MALHDAMAADDRVLVFGEDVAKLGGVFRVTEGLSRNLRRATVFRHPAGGVGHHRHRDRDGDPRLRPGSRDPVRRVLATRRSTRWSATWRSTGCAPTATSTCRSPSGSRRSAESVRSNIIRSPPKPTGLHTAGLKVVVPSTPSDAYWLLRHAIASRDPVIYLEPKRRYWSREDVDTSAPGTADRPRRGTAHRRRRHRADVRRRWSQTALSAADLAADQYGWNLEVVDLRSLNPLDFDTVAASVRKTGRAVVMHEGAAHAGLRCRVGGPHPGGAVLRPGGAGVARHRF